MSEQPPVPAAPEDYDVVRYLSAVHPQTHPDRMFVNAKLLGLSPPPVDSCRVLELGCGDGANLMAVAAAHPGCQCVGIDTSAAAIADGQALAADAQLGNVSLSRTDVMDIGPDFGTFDYVIAHGLYSWVPPQVREKVLAICRANLAPGGVAYVSYNVYPGSHFRQMVRGLMTYHARRFNDAETQVRQARAVLKFFADALDARAARDEKAAPSPPRSQSQAYARARGRMYRELLRSEAEHLAAQPAAITFHDDLAAFNTPVYFHEFCASAAANGLQYLAEADFFETQPPVPGAPAVLPPELMRAMDQMPADDVVAREQYADFAKCRQFRQTLLCHAEVRVQRPGSLDSIPSLYAATAARPQPPDADLRSAANVNFVLPSQASFGLNHPAAKAAIAEMGEAWPRRLAFAELVERAQARVGALAGEASLVPRAVSQVLLQGYGAGVVELHAHPIEMALAPGDRPAATGLARAQARRGGRVTNQLGTMVDLSGLIPRLLVQMLDGTRPRAQLATDLAAACRQQNVAFERYGRRITDEAGMAAVFHTELDAKLNELAKLGVLTQ